MTRKLKKIIKGIKNLIIWSKVIYTHDYYDYWYLYKILEKHIKEMIKYRKRDSRFVHYVGYENDTKKMEEVYQSLKRLTNENYDTYKKQLEDHNFVFDTLKNEAMKWWD